MFISGWRRLKALVVFHHIIHCQKPTEVDLQVVTENILEIKDSLLPLAASQMTAHCALTLYTMCSSVRRMVVLSQLGH